MSGPSAAPAGFVGDPIRQIARGSTLSGLGAIVAAGGGVALTLVVTRSFAPNLAGTFFAATAFFLIVSSLAQLGTDVGLVRYVSGHSATGQQHRLAETLRIALLPVLLASTLVAVAMWFFAPTLAGWIGTPSVYDETISMLRALTPFVPVAALYGALLGATRGRGSMKYTVFVDSVFRTLGQPVLFGVTVLLGWAPFVSAAAWALPYAVGVVICSVVLWRQARTIRCHHGPGSPGATVHLPHEATSAPVVSSQQNAPHPADEQAAVPSAIERSLRRDFWSFTAARGLAGAVIIVWRRFDVLLVAALAGPADAAVYTAATRFLVVGSLGIQAVQMTVSPQLGRLFAQHDLEGARRVYATSTMWTMLFAWPLYIVTAAAVSLVIPIFGAGYDAGSSAVVVLSAAMLVGTACGGVDAVLLMSGRSLLSLGNAVVTLAVNVGLDLWLIPEYGILGAASGWALSIILRNVLALVQINQLMKMWPFNRRSASIAVVSIACFGALPTVLTATEAPSGWLVASLVGGAVVYIGWALTSRASLELDTFALSLRRRRATQPR